MATIGTDLATGDVVVRDSSGTVKLRINDDGEISGDGASGTNTGDVALAAVGSTPNANGASLSGQTLTLQPASAAQPGVITAGVQTIGGAKTFADTGTFSGTVNAGTFNVTGGSVLTGNRLNAAASAKQIVRGNVTTGNAVRIDSGGTLAAETDSICEFGGGPDSPIGVSVMKSGRLKFDATDSSGTAGAATINKPSGQVAIAAGAASVVVTNSVVTAASVVVAVLQFADATLTQILRVVPGAGSFTVTGNANATADTKLGFVVFN